MLTYPLGNSGEFLSICPEVLKHFEKHKQRGFFSRESGGPIFVKSEGGQHHLTHACGPFPRDIRTRFSFIPHRPSTQRCINEKFAQGFHYVGSWHSHPESNPTPSVRDFQTMRNLFSASQHGLNAFIFIIVGRNKFPEGLHVSTWSDQGHIELSVRLIREKVSD